ASATGYRSERADVELERRREARIRLRLLEASPVHGRVTDGDGKPVANALVVFYAPDRFVGRDPADHAFTDADGRYRLADVPVGPAFVTVIASGYDAQDAELEVAGDASSDFRLQRGESADYRVTVPGASPALWSEIRCQLRAGYAESN